MFDAVPDTVGSPIVAMSSWIEKSQLAVSADGGLSPASGNSARLKNASHPASLLSVKYTLILTPCATAATTLTSTPHSSAAPDGGLLTAAGLLVYVVTPTVRPMSLSDAGGAV